MNTARKIRRALRLVRTLARAHGPSVLFTLDWRPVLCDAVALAPELPAAAFARALLWVGDVHPLGVQFTAAAVRDMAAVIYQHGTPRGPVRPTAQRRAAAITAETSRTCARMLRAA